LRRGAQFFATTGERIFSDGPSKFQQRRQCNAQSLICRPKGVNDDRVGSDYAGESARDDIGFADATSLADAVKIEP
jgi:hypothetical protein